MCWTYLYFSLIICNSCLPTDGLSPGNKSVRISAILPEKQDAELYVDVVLEPTEVLDTVTWFKHSNDTPPLAIYKKEDNSTSDDVNVKYKADVKVLSTAGKVRLNLVIVDAFNAADKFSSEGEYFVEVKLSSPAELQVTYQVQLIIYVATRLSMAFASVRKVGASTTVQCIAKGWKPQPVFVQSKPGAKEPLDQLLIIGTKFNRNVVISSQRMNVTSKERDNGAYDVTASTTFMVTNKYRGVMMSCAAKNAATGENIFIVNQVFDETLIYKPSVGEPCVYPPTTARSQCSRDDFSAGICAYGSCNDIYQIICSNDGDCGDTEISRLQCIDDRCQCNTQVFDQTWYEPYCKPSVGTICGSEAVCKNPYTICVEGTCQCNKEVAELTTIFVRGESYRGCDSYL